MPAIKYTIFITAYSYTQMSKQENLKLIITLELAITGLNKLDWEYPFGTFLWNVSEKGAFSIEKIFDIKVVSEETFLSSFSVQKFIKLNNFLLTVAFIVWY